MDLQTYLETQPMKRHTQPHDRYQITDSCCGLVATRTSLAKASEAAKIHAERHGSEGDNTVTVVEVFDTMARRDCMDTWIAKRPCRDKNGPFLMSRYQALSMLTNCAVADEILNNLSVL
jgi:hypothetical protein